LIYGYMLVVGLFSFNIVCSFCLAFKHYMKNNTTQEFKLGMTSFVCSVLLYSSVYTALMGGAF
jgi:hypothetical protein